MRATTVAIGAFLVVLAACGSDDPAAPAAPTVASLAPTPAPTTAPVTVTTAPAPPVTTLPATTTGAPPPTPAPTTTTGVTVPSGPDGIEATWQAVSGTVDGAPVALIETAPITLVIEAGEAGGSAACNSYGGFVDVTDTTIAFLGLGRTEIGCDGPLMDLEETYIGSLAAAPDQTFDYVIEGTTLTLSAAGTVWVYEWVPPTPDAELAGTTWGLNSLIDPMSYSTVVGMESASLRLATDGTATGSTSCREFRATWAADGDGLRFADFVVEGECTGGSVEADARFAEVLGGEVSVQLDGSQLVLMSPDGTGLQFLAR